MKVRVHTRVQWRFFDFSIFEEGPDIEGGFVFLHLCKSHSTHARLNDSRLRSKKGIMDFSFESEVSAKSVAALQRKVSELQRKLKHERFAKEDALTKAKLERGKLRRQLQSEREAHSKRVSSLIAQKRTWKQDALADRGKELRDLRVLLEEADQAKSEALQFSPRNASRPDHLDFAGEASTLWVGGGGGGGGGRRGSKSTPTHHSVLCTYHDSSGGGCWKRRALNVRT